MKKMLCIVLALMLCACAFAETADLILPIGLPFGATVEDVTGIDPGLIKHEFAAQTIYIGSAPTEVLGYACDSHNYIFDENGSLIYYVCGLLPADLAAFENTLKETIVEMVHISADGAVLDYNAVSGELDTEYWTTTEKVIGEYAADGFEMTYYSQYLVSTDAGYVGIILEGLSMDDGETFFELGACYFTLMDTAAGEILAGDPKIAG